MIPFYEFATRRPITLTPDVKRIIGNLKTLWRKRAEENGHKLSNFSMATVYRINHHGSWKDHKLGFDPTFVSAHCHVCERAIHIIADLDDPVRQFKINEPCPEICPPDHKPIKDIHFIWRGAILTEVRAARGMRWDDRVGRDVPLTDKDYVGIAVYSVETD